jgi:hypothetical protein
MFKASPGLFHFGVEAGDLRNLRHGMCLAFNLDCVCIQHVETAR